MASGAATLSGGDEERFEDFWACAIRHFAQALQQTMPRELLVNVTGLRRAQEMEQEGDFIRIRPEDIKGEFSFNIRAGSTLPENHNARFAKLLQVFQIFVDDPDIDQAEIKRQLLEEAGLDTTMLLNEQQRMALADVQAQQGPPQGAEGGGVAAGQNLNPELLRLLTEQGPVG